MCAIDQPLTCDRCMQAPASLLLLAAKDARDRRPKVKALRTGERLLRLLCAGCEGLERAVLERGGRVFTVLAVTAIDSEAATAARHQED